MMFMDALITVIVYISISIAIAAVIVSVITYTVAAKYDAIQTLAKFSGYKESTIKAMLDKRLLELYKAIKEAEKSLPEEEWKEFEVKIRHLIRQHISMKTESVKQKTLCKMKKLMQQ